MTGRQAEDVRRGEDPVRKSPSHDGVPVSMTRASPQGRAARPQPTPRLGGLGGNGVGAGLAPEPRPCGNSPAGASDTVAGCCRWARLLPEQVGDLGRRLEAGRPGPSPAACGRWRRASRGRPGSPRGGRRVVADAPEHGQRGLGPERRAAGAQGVEHAAQAEQVAAVVDRLARRPAPGTCTAACRRSTPLCVRLASSAARARPKSVILTRSTPFSSRMLAGLTSRWTSPWAWAAASPRRRLHADPQDLRRRRSGPSRSSRSCSEHAADELHHQVRDRAVRRSTAWMATTCSCADGGGGPGLAGEPLAGRRRWRPGAGPGP